MRGTGIGLTRPYDAGSYRLIHVSSSVMSDDKNDPVAGAYPQPGCVAGIPDVLCSEKP